MVRAECSLSDGSLSPGKGEWACGSIEPQVSLIGFPLSVSSPVSGDNSQVWDSMAGSIRHSGEFPTPSILHPGSVSVSQDDRCSVDQVAGGSSVLFYPFCSNSEGGPEDARGPGRCPSSSSSLTKEVLVSSSLIDASVTPVAIPSTAISSQCSDPLSGIPEVALFGGLEAERKFLIAQGCSVEVTESIQLSRNQSTIKLYEPHWGPFRRWYFSKNLEPVGCEPVKI